MSTPNTRDERGFSLVEVVVAMVILTVGVLGLAASSGAVGRLTTMGTMQARASNAAMSKIEGLRASGNCSTMAGGNDTFQGGFTRTWTTAYAGNVQTVTMTVSYNDGRKTRSVTFVSQISCVPRAG